VTNPPTPADLAETIEVQFTPEIIAKAQELGNNPVKIYNWVRNNIEFVPTYGSIQGAHMTLLTKQGNAFDTASLLIALLRVSNIPARYVYGTIELPIDKVMNWVGGFTDANAACDFIASGGIPVTGIISGGKVTKARLEHVWVEAWVGYGPYSGRPSTLDPVKSWIPLDSSFKQYTYTDGINLQTAIPFDAQGFLNQLKSTSVINESESYITNVDSNYIQTALNNYQEQLKNYFTHNMPNATAGDILGKREINTQELGILPANLPYKCIVIGNRWSVLLENLRHKVTLTVNDPYLFEISLSYSATIPELLGKRITLHFVPATSVDEQIIATNAGSETLPAYIINVKPILSIDGVTVANGSSITLGMEESFLMEFYSPSSGVDIINNSIITGALYSVGLDPQIISVSMAESFKQKVENLQERLNLNPSGITNEEIIGNILYATVSGYFAELDTFNHFLEGIYKVRTIKPTTFAGIASANVQVEYVFGIPLLLRASGTISLDVDRAILASFSRTGEKEILKQFLSSSGYISSELEASIHEQLWKPYGIRGISATRVLKLANEAGIPIYLLNKDNVSRILPILNISSVIKDDITNCVNAGKEVIIPQRNISINSWSGIGYVVRDKNTGAAAYLIFGGKAGGEFIDVWDLLWIWGSGFLEKFAGRLLGHAAGIIGVLHTYVRNIIKIIDLQNANALERAVLATFAGVALIYAAAIVIFGGGELLAALILASIISIIASVILELLMEEIETAFYQRQKYRFAFTTIPSKTSKI